MEINVLLTQLLCIKITHNLYINYFKREFKLDLGLIEQKRLKEMKIMSHFYPSPPRFKIKLFNNPRSQESLYLKSP